METVEDGRNVVHSATCWTAFSVIAYNSQPVSLNLCTSVCVVCVCVCVLQPGAQNEHLLLLIEATYTLHL